MIGAQTFSLSCCAVALGLVVALGGAIAPSAAAAQESPVTSLVPESHATTPESTGADQEHAVAQEHGDADAAAEHGGPTWREYAFKWINFVLLAFLLYWVLVVAPPFVRENFEFDGLRDVLGSRAQQVVAERDLAQQQQATATTQLVELAARLERVEQEAATLLTEARESAGRDAERLIVAASADAEVIRASASRDLDAEVARARRALQIHVADQAVSIAKQILQDNFSAADQQRLVLAHLGSLGESVA